MSKHQTILRELREALHDVLRLAYPELSDDDARAVLRRLEDNPENPELAEDVCIEFLCTPAARNIVCLVYNGQVDQPTAKHMFARLLATWVPQDSESIMPSHCAECFARVFDLVLRMLYDLVMARNAALPLACETLELGAESADEDNALPAFYRVVP